MGVRLLKTVLVTLAVLIGTYAIALGLGLIAFDLLDVSDREGANSMALAFLICPAIAVAAALAAAIWYFLASGRDKPAAAVSRGRKSPLLIVAASVVAGYLGGWLLQWILWGQSYETWLAAFTVSMAPWIGAVLLGGIALSLGPRSEAG